MSTVNASEPNIQAGLTLHSSSSEYTILELIGEGSFGQVAKCQNLQTGDFVAIKVLEKDPDLMEDAIHEVSILKTISVLDPDSINVVKFLEQFDYMEQTCLAFELLEASLYDIIDHNDWEPMHLRKIRPIAKQLFDALAALQTFGLLHSDIKPDNIMVVREQEEPVRVKLIDFGEAIPANQVQLGEECQPIGYRAPEVSLGLPYNEAIDVWGVGCVLGFLFLAQNLFPILYEYCMIKRMVEILGQPADHLLWKGAYTGRFFTLEEAPECENWRLQTPEEYAQNNGFIPEESDTAYLLPNSLDNMTDVHPKTLTGEEEDTLAFVSLMKGLLHLDGSLRLTPHQALQHPFITMTHLRPNEDFTDYLSGSQEKMRTCQETGVVHHPVEQADSWHSVSPCEVPDDQTNGDETPPLPQWVDHAWCPDEEHPGPQSWNYDVDQPNQSLEEELSSSSAPVPPEGLDEPVPKKTPEDLDEPEPTEPPASEPQADLGQDAALESAPTDPPAATNTSSVSLRKRIRRFFKSLKKRAIGCFCCRRAAED